MDAKPEHLKPRDRVAVIAPASPFDRRSLNRGLAFLKEMGLVPVPGKHLFDRKGYLAGSDEARLEDLLWALETPEIRGVFFARGGYGSIRIATALVDKDFEPKVVMGFSDNCAVLFALSKRSVVFHGPHVCSPAFAEPSARFKRWFAKALMTPKPIGYLPGKLRALREGSAEGRIVVCNLSVLTSSISTPIEPDLSSRIVILEEVNEPPYRIDRMLTQLRM
ncbi:MAG TPA: LD-carboxypeptidase [Proteobacteria bacterium]|nr:LD-carboxypeptidase [Pseudomonadota bacterium]